MPKIPTGVPQRAMRRLMAASHSADKPTARGIETRMAERIEREDRRRQRRAKREQRRAAKRAAIVSLRAHDADLYPEQRDRVMAHV